jgi:hypothetical protein
MARARAKGLSGQQSKWTIRKPGSQEECLRERVAN